MNFSFWPVIWFGLPERLLRNGVHHSTRSLGNGVCKNGVRNRCPYRRCGVDTKKNRIGFPFADNYACCLFLPARVALGVDTEFPYQVRIVDRGVDCRDPVCRHRFRFLDRPTSLAIWHRGRSHRRPNRSESPNRRHFASLCKMHADTSHRRGCAIRIAHRTSRLHRTIWATKSKTQLHLEDHKPTCSPRQPFLASECNRIPYLEPPWPN